MKIDQNTSPEENIIWKRTKIVLKFWSRHFFTIPAVFIFFMHLIHWSDNVILSAFWVLFAAGLDIAKFRSNKDYDSTSSRFEYVSLQDRDSWNKDLVGTPSYLMNISVESFENKYH